MAGTFHAEEVIYSKREQCAKLRYTQGKINCGLFGFEDDKVLRLYMSLRKNTKELWIVHRLLQPVFEFFSR